MNLLPLLLTLTTFLLPLTAAFTSTFQNCQNLNRLNQTVHRVHPLLEKFSSVHASQSQTAVTTTTTTLANGTTITVTNTTSSSAAVERIEGVRALLLSSQEKIYGRLSNCSSDVAPRDVLVKGSVKRDDDDDDDDDDSCTLTDVLNQLVDTLECVLSFATGLLETILDGVFDLLKDVIEGVEKLL
ncbi:hypothetical protein BO83DRAFT_220091 [Aspergillus eucalypticola CBS 122712]|uniref:Cell wall protein n=1 Tax=Aspergillus eucalypticola (strain CBS 122712 / IBT 29274) TaxID=1448314 RepID=A0A317VX85_ASPEC|nr:uncharacterized protein BO83DRAFT_220091 [Aspergillus eucalypticola CBS 122712]PWY77557.1 hypothetical protein BO83DRAFT_220091 [Aspergillus eucalypticola CBS 122712]